MLLLDRNNEPTSTVYYLAAAAYNYTGKHDGINASDLYREVIENFIGRKVSYNFFLMALDFLFLLDHIFVDEKGGLHVHQINTHSRHHHERDNA